MTEALNIAPVQDEPIKPTDTTSKFPTSAKVGLNEAARLTGASKTTIIKYAEEGKVSFEFNGAGKKVYQVAELQRVFGDLKVPPSSALEQQDQIEPVETALKMAVLEEKLRHAEELSGLYMKQAEEAKQNAERWQIQAERATLMLTHRPEPAAAPEPATHPKKKFLGIFGGR